LRIVTPDFVLSGGTGAFLASFCHEPSSFPGLNDGQALGASKSGMPSDTCRCARYRDRRVIARDQVISTIVATQFAGGARLTERFDVRH
jgi:hypothetical protein